MVIKSNTSLLSKVYFNRTAMMYCVSTSAKEPKATEMNCNNSLLLFLALPSAMVEGTETAALRICELSPNLSSPGKPEEIL